MCNHNEGMLATYWGVATKWRMGLRSGEAGANSSVRFPSTSLETSQHYSTPKDQTSTACCRDLQLLDKRWQRVNLATASVQKSL